MKVCKITALFLSALLLLAGCGISSQPQNSVPSSTSVSSARAPLRGPAPEPEVDNSWKFDEPANHGVDGAALDRLHTALADTRIHSVVTVRDGVIIDEYYAEGYDETSIFPVHSVSKNFTSALVGIAIDEGLISGVDAKLADYLPEAANTDKADITLRQLLTHTGGFEWYEWAGRADTFFEWRASENWVDYILKRRMIAQPGSTFTYTTGGTHLLTAVLQRVTGEDALEYGRAHIFEPLGMGSVEWGADPQGIMDGGNGLLMTARDAARFGQLFLQQGKWHDRQLVPQTWVAESTGLQFERPGYDSYGYQCWLRNLGGYDTYFAMGAFGQFIFVVPDLDLVTVMTSTHRENTYLPRDYFRDYILPACTASEEAA